MHRIVGYRQCFGTGLFIFVYSNAVDAANPAGKPLGQLRISYPDVEDLRSRERHRVEDSLDADLVRGGFLPCPIYRFLVRRHTRLLAAAILSVGGIGARFCCHRMLSYGGAIALRSSLVSQTNLKEGV